MIDLVTDFKKIINKGTEKTIDSLNEVFKSLNIEKNKEFIRNITKYYMVIAIWFKNLKENISENDDRRFLLDNILLDYCSILNCVILGDEKIINFLYRNVIESMLRFVTCELTTKEIDKLFNKISQECKGNKEKKIMQTYVSVLKSIYDESCLYIHTDVDKIPSDLKNLIDYNNKSKKLDMSKLINSFNNLNISIFSILQIKYYDIYLNFKSNTKGLINEVMPLKYRIRNSEFENERRNINIL
ncbi:hypothetical protein FDB81_07375 [Clostridium sporogenes]|uniref:hypothetical protein n=1 Tax=Clostridium sporogenes TaxID=1509 RepID=UPI0013D1E752|nr:hypothetical protein [Clostridium sporogenes]NFL75549.1 hypothetical protein [Clostridium sporogenes]